MNYVLLNYRIIEYSLLMSVTIIYYIISGFYLENLRHIVNSFGDAWNITQLIFELCWGLFFFVCVLNKILKLSILKLCIKGKIKKIKIIVVISR